MKTTRTHAHALLLLALGGDTSFLDRSATICGVDPPAPGPGPTPPAPTPGPTPPEGFLSKDDVGKIVQDRIGPIAKERDALKEQLAATESMRKELDDLKHAAAIAGKPEHEQKRIEAERLAAERERALGSTKTELEQARATALKADGELASYIVRTELTQALAPTVLGAALGDAVELMRAQTNPRVETGSDGVRRIVMTVDGVDTTNLVDGAKAWLAKKPHLMKHPGGGTGQLNGNGGNLPTNLEGQTIGGLLHMGLNQPPR